MNIASYIFQVKVQLHYSIPQLIDIDRFRQMPNNKSHKKHIWYKNVFEVSLPDTLYRLT